VSGEELGPSPENFCNLYLRMASFGAFLSDILKLRFSLYKQMQNVKHFYTIHYHMVLLGL